MILDHMDDHMGEDVNHMMGWGTYGWFYMILGFLAFFIFVLILIYLLNRGPSLVEDSTTKVSPTNQRLKNEGKYREFENENGSYCPNCGIKLTNRTLTYCPHCGTKL
ncbi:MAG: hypothetical protein EU535_07495 [Promethearchaeota archaeon]|nr:MAG: hypothetical protein EU535_07495 [Candidatus Lokiarchaeota archaeon]